MSIVVSAQQDTLQQVPGTKTSLRPPDGFILSKEFTGFIHESGASILITEIPTNFLEITREINREHFAKGGMELLRTDSIYLREQPAFLYTLSQQAYGQQYIKQILLFGSTEWVVMVTASFPTNSDSLQIPLRQSLISAQYEPKIIADPFVNMAFTLKPERFDFRFAAHVSEFLFFTPDGILPHG